MSNNPYISHQSAGRSSQQQQPNPYTPKSSSFKKHTSRSKPSISSNSGGSSNGGAGSTVNQLHPKNYYRIQPVNFYAYASQYPTLLGPHIEGITVDHSRQRCAVNWKSLAATRAVSEVMLRHDFQLDVAFLPHALIPPLPNRLNYLCWLSDLHESNVSVVGHDPKNLTILDIGTGSNLIYPLLGAQYFQFKFIGSDVNPMSIQYAQQLIAKNQATLKNEIHVVTVPPSSAMQQFLVQYYLSPILHQQKRAALHHISSSGGAMAMSDDVVDIEEADLTTSQRSQCSAMEDDGEQGDGFHDGFHDDDNDELSSHQSSATFQSHSNGTGCKLLETVHAYLLTCATNRQQHQNQQSNASNDNNGGGVMVHCKRGSIVEHDDVIASRGPIRAAFANMGDSYKYRLLDCEYAWLNRATTSTSSSGGSGGSNADHPEEASAAEVNHGFSPKRVKRTSSTRESSEENQSLPTQQPQQQPLPQPVQKWRPILFACMTNPPFYDLNEDVQENEETVCAGTDLEMKTFGGEVAFIASMIVDSLILRESVLWYTAMVGKKSSLKVLKKLLLQEGVPLSHIFTTVFAQGVTHRWGLGWTFVPEAAALYACFNVLGSGSGSSSSSNNTGNVNSDSNSNSNSSNNTISHNTGNSNSNINSNYSNSAAPLGTVANNPGQPMHTTTAAASAGDTSKAPQISSNSNNVDLKPLEFDMLFQDYLATSLVEETKDMFVYLQSRNLSINTDHNVALTALVPIVATRLNVVCSKLEEAYSSINIKSHIADVSYITSQGTFGHTAAKGQLRIEVLHNGFATHDADALSLVFHIHYVDVHFQKQLVTMEIFLKVIRIPPQGYIQLKGKVQIVNHQCAVGLASRLQHRTNELMESEFLRNTRK
jgi:23S rRNA A1618 N6-methylase RlmF